VRGLGWSLGSALPKVEEVRAMGEWDVEVSVSTWRF
jgi:hypothetical protein